ncbi:MAG: tRNA pseudouridine32 synthase/23S rRNA pseudouridine746 synthase [Thiomicrorhabdus sp.]|nr:MAG: tRNA pseudouridine32 synthase/23S rRNA pseudouridine746 synthase [Thiomicrorhabdus sp.]
MQPQADPFIAPPCHEEIDILYQDDSLLLINKPTGLLTLSGKHQLNKDSVHFRLVQDFPTANVIHRLDLGTSGIMIVALNKLVNGHIGKQFQAGTITKTYTAILDGLVIEDTGEIDYSIAKGEFPLQKVCAETGKKSLTHYQVIKRLEDESSTRVEFRPQTGRTHQLRVHSAEIDHPILGCDLYGTDQAFFKADRLMLHATTIEFNHPVTGKRVRAEAPCSF